jgi:endo-1,3-1,4-beta-glycanase ExoK
MEAWMGRLQYPGRPLVTSYEHVAFTALGEPCRFPASVLCGDGR